MSETFAPFITSSPGEDVQSLRGRLDQHGYLFLRGIAPREPLLALRRSVLEVLADAGWVKRVPNLLAGVWAGAGPFTEGDPEYMAVYKRVLHLPEFAAWADDSVFVDFVSALLGAAAAAHKLRIGRITFPNNVDQTTGAHQDFQYIRGSAETYTIWTPIGDCSELLGGLAVLAGSHRAGFIEHSFNPIKRYAGHGLTDDQMPTGDKYAWHSGAFAAGDVLLFHSYTIHKARPNLTTDRLRVSTDNRYQRITDVQIAPVSQGSHYNL